VNTKHPNPWIWELPGSPDFTWDSAALTAPLSAARRAQGEVIGAGKLLDADMDLSAQLEVLTAFPRATPVAAAIEHGRFVARKRHALVELAPDLTVELTHRPAAAQRFGFVESAALRAFNRQQPHVG
jgi:hypothetical protein